MIRIVGYTNDITEYETHGRERVQLEWEGDRKNTNGVKEWEGEHAWGDIYLVGLREVWDLQSTHYKVTVIIEEVTDDE